MITRYKGRHRRPTQNPALADVARPAVVISAAAALSLGMMAPASAHTGEHTVRPGDTLSSIAADHGASWRTLWADNRDVIGADPNVLRVGQVLSIGGPGGPAPAAPAPSASGAYAVRAGDTLSTIAARHGTTWQQLHALNLDVIGADPNVLRIGQRLAVGGGGSAPAAPAVPERASRAERAAPVDVGRYGVWEPHVRPAVQEVSERFGISTVLTRPGHSPTEGRAADFMVYSDRATGDAVAQYVIDNAARFHVEYVIWRQRIFIVSSGEWRAMEDRGSPTANHMDHPHVAFLPAG